MKRNNKGFMLVELMVTIGIIIATLSVVGINASKLNSDLDQTKADATAMNIYLDSQECIKKLYTSGQDELLSNQRVINSYTPENYTGTENLRYILSTDPDINSFVSNTNHDGEFIIEYDSVFGRVFGVYYSAKELNDYKGNESDNALRSMNNEQKLKFANDNKYNISYYGGDYMDATVHEPEPKEEDDVVPVGFCYYEIYASGDVGYYTFASPGEDKLKDELVVGDGYGIILKNAKDATSVIISGTKSATLDSNRIIPLESGVIAKLPTEWMCANWLDNSKITGNTPTNKSQYNTNYYWTIDISYGGLRGDEHYSYSPYYAKSAVTPTLSSNLPSTVYIRSARQLNALSWMYSSYYNKKWAWNWTPTNVVNTTFKQEVNIDYSAYDFSTYTGRAFAGQMPIGTDWGRFISNYDGGGNTISNLTLLRRSTTGNEYTYAGLFGFVSLGSIKNVNVVNANITNADYAGILATYVQNATVSGCSVSDSSITFKQTNTYNQTTGSNEFANARVGLLIGYVKCPEEDNSKYSTLISYCSVNNSTITAPDYMQTSAYYRQYQIGGLIGAAANFESNQSRASHITISNCSVNCKISTKSYGKGSNYCYIGGFAGAIKKYVTIENPSINVTGLNTSKHYSDYYSS